MFPVIIAGLRLIRPGFVNVFVSDFYKTFFSQLEAEDIYAFP